MLRKLQKHWGHYKSASMQDTDQVAHFTVFPGIEKYKEDFDRHQKHAPETVPDLATIGDGKIVHKTPFAKYLVGKYSPHEETSQKVFHAAGLGDYHQKSFTTSYQDKELYPANNKNVVTVSVIEPNFVTLDLADHDYSNETWFKLAIIDAALGHPDRKDADVLVSRESGSPLLVNNGNFESRPESLKEITKKASGYTYLPNVANREEIINKLMTEWWPTVQWPVTAILGTTLAKHAGHDYIAGTSSFHQDRGGKLNDIPINQLAQHTANLYADRHQNPLHADMKAEFDAHHPANPPMARSGTIALEGLNRKVIHKIGDTKYMVKPYTSHEGLSQKVFDAAGLWHLHQKSFTSNYSEDGKTNPSTIVKVEPNYRTLLDHDEALDVPIGGQHGEFAGDYAKISVLDGVLGQADRHSQNIMAHKVNGQPLAIDNEGIGNDHMLMMGGSFEPLDLLAIHMHDNSHVPMDDARDVIDKHIRPWWPTVSNKIIEASSHHHLGDFVKRRVDFITKALEEKSLKKDEHDGSVQLLLKARDLIKKLNESIEQPTPVAEPQPTAEPQPNKNLVVFHATRANKLHYFDDAHDGYMPGPSIGIQHRDNTTTVFGDITLLAHPSLVDPTKPDVHVFNTDAFTPTNIIGHQWEGGDMEKLQKTLGHGLNSIQSSPYNMYTESGATKEGHFVNNFYKENPRLKKPDREKHLYHFTKWLSKKYREAGFTRAKSTEQILDYMKSRPLIGGEEGASTSDAWDVRRLNSLEEIKHSGQRTDPNRPNINTRVNIPIKPEIGLSGITQAVADVNNNNTPAGEAIKDLVQLHNLTPEETKDLEDYVKVKAELEASKNTPFLEAKILRPVHLSEFHTAVVPHNMSPAHIQHLKKKYGLNVVKYDDSGMDYKEKRKEATHNAAHQHDLLLSEKPIFIPLTKSTTSLLETVQNALKVGDVYSTDQQKDERLVGKHTQGTLVAHDKTTGESVMLKPGSGPQNATAGATDTSASQTNREAAFYNIAKAMGLGDFLPEVRVINVKGAPYAAIHMLPLDKYKDMNQVGEDAAKRVLSKYTLEIYKWAAMDYILGNADRNAGNVMTDGTDIKLIDHGSAFGGANFAPIKDNQSFIPYYLRVNTPPHLNQAATMRLAEWLRSIPTDTIKKIATSYGIDPAAIIDRINYLQRADIHHKGIMSAWGIG